MEEFALALGQVVMVVAEAVGLGVLGCVVYLGVKSAFRLALEFDRYRKQRKQEEELERQYEATDPSGTRLYIPR